MEYVLSEIIKDPDACPIMHETGYLVYRIHKINSEWNRDNYIGDTNKLLKDRMFDRRWGHLNLKAKLATHKLRDSVLEYGMDNFTLEIIYKGDYIDWLEEYYITMHDSYENGYNLNRNGKGSGGLTSEFASRIARKQAADGTHPFMNLTKEQLSQRSIKSAKTRGHDSLSAVSSRTAKRQIADDTHPFMNLTDEQLSRRAKNGAENANKSRAIKWIFHNTTTNEYKVHVANWRSRYFWGFDERLCKFEDWDNYRINNNINCDLLLDQ